MSSDKESAVAEWQFSEMKSRKRKEAFVLPLMKKTAEDLISCSMT
jgi:hypothetical protein